MPETEKLNQRLVEVLAAHEVEIVEPREHMVQLNAVLAGAGFSKPRTNVLLRHRSDDWHWEIFVDEDFRYLGEDRARSSLFGGRSHERWLELTPPEPVAGDVNEAVLRALEYLDSPMRGLVPAAERRHRRLAGGARQIADPQLARVARLLDPRELRARAVRPTHAQAEAVARIAQSVTSRGTARCPVVCGASGCGKTAVVALAALELLGRGVVRQVVELSGAAVCAGAVFWPQRDDRLRLTLESAHELEAALVVLEQFDLTLGSSAVAGGLFSEWVDRGLRLVGVARGEFSLSRLEQFPTLSRRLEPVLLGEPEPDDLEPILLRLLKEHPLAKNVELAPEVVPAVLNLSHRRPGVNPGAALGLIEAALAQAAWSGSAFIGPDDLYCLVPPEEDESL
jgi:hypothetical protein